MFAKYGEVETIKHVRGPDQKSRGCLMVQFKKWAAAEAAMEALNGTSLLEGNKSRALVVNFANPRRGSIMSTPGETAIAPRKLIVGQVH
jgi:CUG-BP- and ETR3-like factor